MKKTAIEEGCRPSSQPKQTRIVLLTTRTVLRSDRQVSVYECGSVSRVVLFGCFSEYTVVSRNLVPSTKVRYLVEYSLTTTSINMLTNDSPNKLPVPDSRHDAFVSRPIYNILSASIHRHDDYDATRVLS